jgi:hypothetical protein
MPMQITKPTPKPRTPTAVMRERKGVMRGHREQFTMTLPPETLDRVERMARDHGMTRAALLSLFVHRGLERGLS